MMIKAVDVARKRKLPRSSRMMFMNMERRAARKEMAYDISKEWLFDEILRTDGLCARTGRELFFTDNARHPWQLSLDRLDNDVGYVPGNVEVVAYIYNMARQGWDHKLVKEFAEIIIEFDDG